MEGDAHMAAPDLSKRARLVGRSLLAPIFMILLQLLAAGRWDYWQAWVYWTINLAIMVLMATVLTKDVSLMEERLNPREGMKGWDKFYFAVTVPLYILALALGGLDARFGWSRNISPVVYWSSVLVYLAGQAIFQWARYINRYFSSVVRIQTDRGQIVCTEGPYRYIRHPGYLGGFLYTVMVGLVLGSWWASIPQIIAGLMLVWRTAREDRTLQAELPGYAQYVTETHYRLIPGLW
jgi:protein-S-isoprenylcysteine O-methyltransferase Ste14